MIILALIFGIIIAKIFGKTELSIINIKYLWILIIGVLIDVMLTVFTIYDFGILTHLFINYYSFIHVLYLLLLGIGLLLNLQNKGMNIIGMGFILNSIPIILNKKMPVKYELLNKIPIDRAKIILEGKSLSHGLFRSPKMYWLSDIIYLPFPYKTIISVGDILIAVGLFLTIIIQADVTFKREI